MMPKYAKYDPTQTPALVTGWYDTDEFNYGSNLPPADNLLEVTADEWQNRTNGQWQVVDQTLGAYTYLPSLTDVINTKTIDLSNSCQKQIVSGFSSSALGVAYNYASTATDQRNILLAAQSSKGGMLSCEDALSVWSRCVHTQAQAQQVLEDFVVITDAARAKLSALETQLISAKNIEAVQAVLWQEVASD